MAAREITGDVHVSSTAIGAANTAPEEASSSASPEAFSEATPDTGASAGAGAGGAVAAARNDGVVVLLLGMAGSGKTSLMQRLNAECLMRKRPSYLINLDPAVHRTPFSANIDIKDTVDYKQVMKEYSLGPNGAIVTSLNLFSTRFDQVLKIVGDRFAACDYVFVDTPGQIEVFTWSASGTIITDSLAASFPTVLLFVVDSPRSQSAVTFMSNMLYACSIMYKTRLPLVIAFNKVDASPADTLLEWMGDFEAFQAALDKEAVRSDAYIYSLTRSLNLALDEFYTSVRAVGVSAATGEGMDELFAAVADARREYTDAFLPELQAAAADVEAHTQRTAAQSAARLAVDMEAPAAPAAPPVVAAGALGFATEPASSETVAVSSAVP